MERVCFSKLCLIKFSDALYVETILFDVLGKSNRFHGIWQPFLDHIILCRGASLHLSVLLASEYLFPFNFSSIFWVGHRNSHFREQNVFYLFTYPPVLEEWGGKKGSIVVFGINLKNNFRDHVSIMQTCLFKDVVKRKFSPYTTILFVLLSLCRLCDFTHLSQVLK